MGKAGGVARIQRHGNPGTSEGRRIGGINSVRKNAELGTRFKTLHRFSIPPNSEKLAELLGILAGDGHIAPYQISITTNSETDVQHALYSKELIESIFPITASISFRTGCKACVVVTSSKHIGDILVAKGLVRGHKIRGQLSMPNWVRKQLRFKKAFIRGLFDTDGSVYLDTHVIRGRTYKNVAMVFTNRCLPLLNDFKETVEAIGLHPTQKTKYAVFLRRAKDIQAYFKIISSSNPKHAEKVRAYFDSQYGGVA